MKILYRFFWALVNDDPKAKDLLLKLKNHNEILQYAINNRLEKLVLDFFNKEKIQNNSIKNMLKVNAKKRSLKSFIIKESLLKVCKELSNNEINYVLLKGANFIDPSYKYANRNLRDIDILIDLNHIQKAIKIFENIGYSFSKKNKMNFFEFANNKYNYDLPPMRNEFGICIEIHFKIIAKSEITPCIFGQNILVNKKVHNIYDTDINFCSKNYLILHLIYHGTSKGFFDVGLNFILDLKKIFYEKKVNINELLQLAKKNDLYKEVILSLNLLTEISYVDWYLKKNKAFIDKQIINDTRFLLASKSSKPALDFLVYSSSKSFIKKLSKSFFVAREIVGREFLVSKNNPFIYIYYCKRWARQIYKNINEFFRLITEEDKRLKIKSIKSLKDYLN